MRNCLKMVIFLFICLMTIQGAVRAEAQENKYLEALGGFGGSYIYMTYAYIGVTADAYSKNIYKAAQVKVMMDESVNMLSNLVKMLEKVQTSQIVENDRKFIDSMKEILGLLKIEAEALSAFAASNDPKDVERYDQARKTAWSKIKQLLGIK